MVAYVLFDFWSLDVLLILFGGFSMLCNVDDIGAADRFAEMSVKDLKTDPFNNFTFGGQIFFLTLVPANFRNLGYNSVHSFSNLSDDEFSHLDDFLISVAASVGAEICYTLCKSAKGYEHGHAVVFYDKTKRFKKVQQDFGKCWVAPMRGTKAECMAYMKKEGRWEEKGEVILRTGGNWSLLDNVQGRRSDLERFDELCRDPHFTRSVFEEWLLANVPPDASRLLSTFEHRFEMNKKVQASHFRRDHVTVIWIGGLPRSGKTWSVYNSKGGMFDDDIVFRPSFSDKNTSFPFDGYSGQRVLHFDEFRPGSLDFTYFLQLCDPVSDFTVNIKNGRMLAAWDTIVITSTYSLRDWFRPSDSVSSVSQSKLENMLLLKAQLFGRIDEYYEINPDTHQKVSFQDEFDRYKKALMTAARLLYSDSSKVTSWDDLYVDIFNVLAPNSPANIPADAMARILPGHLDAIAAGNVPGFNDRKPFALPDDALPFPEDK